VTALLLASAIMVVPSEPSPALASSATVGESANVTAVWELEEAYWRYAAAGDTQHYRELWADGFRGWPSDQPHPVTKAGVTDWIEELREQRLRMTYSLTQEGAAAFGDVVVIYYRAATRFERPDGHVEGGGTVRVTHTWRRMGGVWKIIGGMAADMTAAATK